VNVGVVNAFTVTFIVAVVAHVGEEVDIGVNVYVAVPAVAVEIIAGFQVPTMLLLDVVGKAVGVSF
jgi:hypothetical protein